MITDSQLFPPTFSQMSAVGENTGKLDETLVFLADFYEGELDNSTKSMSNILEPLLLLAMGGVVMFVALAIITPIYSITQTLGR
jgi:type II secretory pathway component PulF